MGACLIHFIQYFIIDRKSKLSTDRVLLYHFITGRSTNGCVFNTLQEYN